MGQGRARCRRGVTAGMLAATLAVTAAACGGDEGGGSGDDGDGPITIGIMLSTEGSMQAYAEEYRQGIEYFKETNDTILGRPVEYVELDDGATPASAVPAAQRLIEEEGVDAVVGPYLSGPTSAVLPVFDQAGVLNVNLSAFADAGDPEQYPYTFHNEWWKDAEGIAMLAHACELGATSIATVAVNNPLGSEVDASIGDNAGDAPCDIDYAGTEQFESGATDATAQAEAVASADAVVIGAASPTDFAVVVNGLAEVQYEGWIMGNQALANPNTLDLLTAGVEDQLVPFGATPQTLRPLGPEVQEVLDGATEFLGEEPVGNWNKGYDSLMIIKQAAEGAGSLDADAMVEWLENNEFCGAWGCFRYSADSHHPFEASDDQPFEPGTAGSGYMDPWEQ